MEKIKLTLTADEQDVSRAVQKLLDAVSQYNNSMRKANENHSDEQILLIYPIGVALAQALREIGFAVHMSKSDKLITEVIRRLTRA